MGLQVSTHTTLLSRLSDGTDSSAWGDFQRRYGELIVGYARRRGLQPADCDDLLQDVLLSLTKVMPEFRYDPSRGRFRAYLKTIVSRTLNRRFRQNHPAVHLETMEAGGVDADAIEGCDDRSDEIWEAEWRQYHVRQAMQTIDAEFNQTDRLAFRHYVVGGEAPGKTAEVLGITVNQVYKSKSAILKRLGEVIALQVKEEG